MAKSNRRAFLKKGPAAVAVAATAGAAAVVVGAPAEAAAQGAAEKPVKKVLWNNGKRPEKQALFSPAVSYGNLLFISGIGAHFEGDIKAHTKHVLDEVEKKLVAAGSSMEKVLMVSVVAVTENSSPICGHRSVSVRSIVSRPLVARLVGV